MKIRALALITALAFPTLAIADNKTPADPKPPVAADTKPGKLSEGDVKIVAHLHHVNQMEIDLGKAAQKNGTASVKAYGEALVKDHQTQDKELTAFAKTRKLATIPADKPQTDVEKQEHKDMMSKVARLKTLKGAEFDKELLTMMVADHDKEIAKLDVSIGTATDPDLQTMLKAVKPVLQRHADQARDLQKNTQASLEPSKLPATPR